MEYLSIKGRVSTGLGEARYLTRFEWVLRQLQEKLNLEPYPGTLNLELEPGRPEEARAELLRSDGITIDPSGASRPARCFKARLISETGAVNVVIIIPITPSYPSNKLELMAAVNLRNALNLKDGELVTVLVIT